ncbi:MAG: hypothetical protein SVU32_00285 [Candidatus Nanohaloarchaea archaeon]|nr:hypothetical protein [Candidatus Nanohaloarchaea archaeon]
MDDRLGWLLLLALFPVLIGAVILTDGLMRWIVVAVIVGYLVYVIDVYAKGHDLRPVEP